MNRNLIIALVLIALAVLVIVYNSATIDLNIVAKEIQIKVSLAFLGFFITGVVTGLLLKGQ